MAIDVTQTIGAVTRTLSRREMDGGPAWVLTAARTFAAPREEVWDALTNPDRVPQWFLPLSGDLRVGGRYQFQGNAGGEILECDRPNRLAVTWEMQGQSWVTIRLSDDPFGGTRMEFEHAAQVPDEFWSQFGPGAVGVGWDQALFGLGEHFTGAPAVKPEEAMAWMVSDEGREFTRQSSAAWRDASVAAGTDPEAASAAADRTTAFYTGESAPA